MKLHRSGVSGLFTTRLKFRSRAEFRAAQQIQRRRKSCMRAADALLQTRSTDDPEKMGYGLVWAGATTTSPLSPSALIIAAALCFTAQKT